MPAGGGITLGGAALAGAIAAPIVGGLFGASSASKARKAAAASAAAALAELNAIGYPPDLSKEIIMQQYQSQGTLTPELMQDIELASSEMGKVQEDANLRSAQMEALNTLTGVARGGLRAEDRAAYNELRANTQRDAEAKRQQILQQMQARGQSGSGAELMAQLQSGQAAEDQASAQADRLAAQASQNALAALTQKAQLAGSIRSQDYGVNSARAQALDDRNRFLYDNSMQRQQTNVGALNQAQQANLANKQRLSEMNTSQSNTESQRQEQAKRDYFQDRLGLASAKANALNNQGSAIAAGYNQQAQTMSGLGNAVGQGFAAFAGNKKAGANEDLLKGAKLSYGSNNGVIS